MITKVEGIAKSESGVKGLLRVKADKAKEILENLPSYCEGAVVSTKEVRILIKEHTCLVALPILDSGCIITGIGVEGDEIIWSIVCDEKSFSELLNKLESYEVDFEIVYKGKLNSGKDITFREEEILRIALEKGFFDFPRKVKLEELADYIGIAPSTLSEIMRRGLKKVLKAYFGGQIS